MPSPGFKTTIPAIEWPQTYALDRMATEIGAFKHALVNIVYRKSADVMSRWILRNRDCAVIHVTGPKIAFSHYSCTNPNRESYF
jgi:hypothetical protein